MTWVRSTSTPCARFASDHDANGGGVPSSSWIDAQGRIVLATKGANDQGFTWSAPRFEIVLREFQAPRYRSARARKRLTRPRRRSCRLTALVAGVRGVAPERTRMRVRRNGRDTLEIVQPVLCKRTPRPIDCPPRTRAAPGSRRNRHDLAGPGEALCAREPSGIAVLEILVRRSRTRSAPL